MATYNYSEAAAFVENEVHANSANFGSAGSVASFDTAEELGYDREVLQEAYAWQHRANKRLERAGYHEYASDSSSSSCSVSSDEPFYLPRDYLPARSFESDRSWHLN
ncbi:uncharacterized protein [Miscanthus floridulus]|uniref:uncharacterized protein n=1 Tax=Miscanthus floridulus TaxID=154761 RepID=UPI003458D3B9